MRRATALAALLATAASAAEARCPPANPLPAPPPRASYLDPQGAVRIVGYNDMAGLVNAWDRLYTAARPELGFAPDLPATRAAPPALIAGRSALAPMGAEMSADDLAQLRQATGAPPLVVRVAHDSVSPSALSGPIVLVVPKANPLSRLSMDQVRRLYFEGGGLATWGELGLTGAWATRPIHRIGLEARTPLAQVLRSRAFPDAGFAPGLVAYGHSTEVIAAVARDPDAIGFTAINAVGPDLKVLPLARHAGAPAIRPTPAALRAGRYPLDRHLLIYARRPLDAFVRAYLQLALSCQGQAAIARDRLGYIPLSPAELRVERAKLVNRRRPGRRSAPGSR